MLYGFFKPALLGQGTPHIVVGFGETRVKGYRLPVMFDGCGKISPLAQQASKVVMCPDKIGFDLQGILVLLVRQKTPFGSTTWLLTPM